MTAPDKDEGRILVVDDNAFVLETTALLLAGFGFDVTPCSDPEDALRRFSSGGFDAVLTDVKMPYVSGIELLRRARAMDKSVPVMLMTAYAEIDAAIEAIKLGAFDFILKPYKPDYLRFAVKRAVGYKRLLRMESEYKTRLEQEVAKRTEELSNALETVKGISVEVAQRMTTIAEFRDSETGAHIKRMGFYSARLAEAARMDKDFVETISFAACMHDMGKIGIPDNILLKPGPLTREEFEIMKTHTAIGGKMLSGSAYPILQMASSIALNHHERFDGTGYPNGKKGEEIPVEGRVLIIADQYDALRSKRPYKKALTHLEAVDIITKGDSRTMPGHFDPALLDIFKKIASEFDDIFKSHQD